jgi:cyclic beta-1,2-glucan synthetase
LPLIGSGDWNDGFSRVGVEGRGESVWLAWFLIVACRRYAELAEDQGELDVGRELQSQADRYTAAVEAEGWDGAWYRRAFHDDGTLLGSSQSVECQIDSLAQSWSIIAGTGDPVRARQGMEAAIETLVLEDARLIMLLTPPFDQAAVDPGYIKGYLPGVRENGGQYTHAALWLVEATALMGDPDRAWHLFRMLIPFTHADTPEELAVYKVEPYAVPADVYTAPGHVGRGGWTWYTGSAGVLYRVGIETLLGFTRRGNQLTIVPRIPAEWPGYEISYRYGQTWYRIAVRQAAEGPEEGERVAVDGVVSPDGVIPLDDDGREHQVVVEVGAARPIGASHESG